MWVVGKVLLLGVCNLKCKLITLTLIRAAGNVLASGYHRIVYTHPPPHLDDISNNNNNSYNKYADVNTTWYSRSTLACCLRTNQHNFVPFLIELLFVRWMSGWVGDCVDTPLPQLLPHMVAIKSLFDCRFIFDKIRNFNEIQKIHQNFISRAIRCVFAWGHETSFVRQLLLQLLLLL